MNPILIFLYIPSFHWRCSKHFDLFLRAAKHVSTNKSKVEFALPEKCSWHCNVGGNPSFRDILYGLIGRAPISLRNTRQSVAKRRRRSLCFFQETGFVFHTVLRQRNPIRISDNRLKLKWEKKLNSFVTTLEIYISEKYLNTCKTQNT